MDNVNNTDKIEVQGNDNKVTNYTSIFEDSQGGLSSIRVLMISWGLLVLITWLIVTIISAMHGNYTIPALPESIVTVLLGVTGIKTYQRQFGEKGDK